MKKISFFLMVFALFFGLFPLHAQNLFDENFKKIADHYDMKYQVPKDYVGTATPIVPTAGGEKHFLSAASSSGSINGHSIDSVIESLRILYKTN